MKGLFILGNKRSGTSQLSRLLNLHPEIYVSKESDVLWILSRYNESQHFKAYPWDSPKGMLNALEIAGHTLSRQHSYRENFINFQEEMMERSFFDEEGMSKPNLQYIGDQKPYQNADSALLSNLLENFPQSKFLHIIRHPFEVIRSAKRFHLGTGGYIWGALSEEEILEEWRIHEQRVLEARNTFDLDIHDLTYNRLIENTEECMAEIYAFLGLDVDRNILWKSRMMTKPNFRRRKNYAVRYTEQKEMMDALGFKQEFNYLERMIIPRVKRRAMIIYIELKKRLKNWFSVDPI